MVVPPSTIFAPPVESGLRPPRHVQVECNAPLSRVGVKLERSAAVPGTATAAAAKKIAAATTKKANEAANLAAFRKNTLLRLRAKAQEGRDVVAVCNLLFMSKFRQITKGNRFRLSPDSYGLNLSIGIFGLHPIFD